MANTGYLFPGTITNDGSIGSVDWGSTSNAGADDTSYASVSSTNSVTTKYLKCTNFNANVPAGSTINSIALRVGRFQTGIEGITDVADASVRIFRAGTIVSTEKANTVDGGWPQFNFGAWIPVDYSANLWGVSWTAAQINDAATGFGIAAAISSDGVETATAFIDFVAMAVDYTAPAPAANSGFFAFFRDRMKFDWPFPPKPRAILTPA